METLLNKYYCRCNYGYSNRQVRLAVAVSLLLIATLHSRFSAAECGADYDELGGQVQAIYVALANPKDPASMNAIIALGRDSRYYTMVRGWLTMQLEGDRSILEASSGEAKPEIVARAEFLEKAIRAIDLE